MSAKHTPPACPAPKIRRNRPRLAQSLLRQVFRHARDGSRWPEVARGGPRRPEFLACKIMHVRHDRQRFAMLTSVKMWSPTYKNSSPRQRVTFSTMRAFPPAYCPPSSMRSASRSIPSAVATYPQHRPSEERAVSNATSTPATE